VLAIELDPYWAAHLRGRWANVEVVEADAATVRLPREPFRVLANLPFDGTNAILRHLLDDPFVPLVRADLIVQWGSPSSGHDRGRARATASSGEPGTRAP
jgi:23S rRNA (adenine-N6)-dimethyltransferase